MEDKKNVEAVNNSIRSLTKQAKRRRVNRVYYKHDFTPKPLAELGILRTKEKNAFDLVVLSPTTNEQIRYYGFNKLGTHFELIINISSLYADVQKPHRESLLRHGYVRFMYEDRATGWRYNYEHEDLLDYQKKRSANDYESTNVYRLGSLSVDINIPFALSRICFNGMINRCRVNQTMDSPAAGESDKALVPARIDISTHPSCDKFDYTYAFSSKFLAETIHKSCNQIDEAQQLLGLALEDRIEQTFMFRCELELPNESVKTRDLLWGAKSKRFVDPRLELANKSVTQPLESLLIWSELGTIIHLRRLVGRPSLIYGMVQCGFDYPSHLYAASCMVPDSAIETDFGRLASFSNIPAGTKMSITAFKLKNLEIVMTEGVNQANGNYNPPFAVSINGIPGWGLCRCDYPGELIKDIQSKLWCLDIHDRNLTYRLSSEALLGGKGSSLVGLSFLTSDRNQSGVNVQQLVDPTKSLSCAGASVPRGVIVSCLAYQMWLESNPAIGPSIRELDDTRKALAARSYYVNPLSDKHLTMAKHQQALRDQCNKASQLLNSCPLPAQVERQLYAQLRAVFEESELLDSGKLFAVRSSAMGEDSVETSAAGQMKTILDSQGFESICRSVVACWASQFELEAVTYKSQNSSLFNWPMAVVIQELISCDVAGVAATCNPIDGRPGQLEITANPGLGEGVVSGKKTDTIRVALENQLTWDPQFETYVGPLKTTSIAPEYLEMTLSGDDGKCCLTDAQIVALSNLFIWLRSRYQAKEREIEWGITSGASSFQIHLLQSRPLTNLARANNSIIAHELDSGIPSPVDVISRANLAEVMPGCLSPLFVSHFLMPTVALEQEKPYEQNHTVECYSSSLFNVSAQFVFLQLTSCESTNRMIPMPQEHRNTLEMMIGYQKNEDFSDELIESMTKVRHHPLFKNRRDLLTMFISDLGYLDAKNLMINRTLNRLNLMHNMTTVDDLISQMDKSQIAKRSPSIPISTSSGTVGSPDKMLMSSNGDKSLKKEVSKDGNGIDKSKRHHDQLNNYTSLSLRREPVDEMAMLIRQQSLALYNRLIDQLLMIEQAWRNHMRGTLLSMGFNMMCLHFMKQQDYYKATADEKERKALIMNDFSVLIRSSNKNKTESGDIGVYLDRIVNCLASEGKLPEARKMSTQELYDSLTDPNNRADSAIKFRYFLTRNGHRAFKEFDYANLTWADDPSYVIKCLAVRLKQHTLATPTNCKTHNSENSEEVKQVHARITTKRRILLNHILPRAQGAVAKRENTKSTLIKTVNFFRKGFRSLGALLCLDGRLSDVNLIFYLTLEELNTLVLASDQRRAELARLVFKARRRQQVFRSLEKLSFPDLTLNVAKAHIAIDNALDGKWHTSTLNDKNHVDQQAEGATGEAVKSSCIVRGMTSCNGIVTGRACVVNSLDEIDLVQPNDILITYSIDVSWTVYFFTIAGIVTEVGGIVSHGAVVAREYGIPTLCMAEGACSKFKTGQMVVLDANKACCYLLSSGDDDDDDHVFQDKQDDTVPDDQDNVSTKTSEEIKQLAGDHSDEANDNTNVSTYYSCINYSSSVKDEA